MPESIVISDSIKSELFKLTEKENTIEAIQSLIINELFRKKNKYVFLEKCFSDKYSMDFFEFEKNMLQVK